MICHSFQLLFKIDESLTLDYAALETAISPRTRAVILVHMLGYPCDMDAIMAVARKHGINPDAKPEKIASLAEMIAKGCTE